MENHTSDDMDRPLDGKLLGIITSDFVKVSKMLQEAAYQVRVRGISEYPLFVMSKEPIQIGQILIDPGMFDGNQWHYYASFMEELVQRGLIHGEGRDIFVEHYKKPDEFACLLVVTKEFTKFTYIPYPEDEEGTAE